MRIKPHEAREGVEEIRAHAQKCDVPHRHVCEDPDHKACGCGNRRGARKHKEGTVKDRAHQNLSHLRLADGRKLERKRRGNTAQQGGGEESCEREGGKNTQQDQRREDQRGHSRLCKATHADYEKHTDDRDQRGETTVAGNEAVGEDRQQPLARRVDDAAAHDPRGITAKAHAHGWLISGYNGKK